MNKVNYIPVSFECTDLKALLKSKKRIFSGLLKHDYYCMHLLFESIIGINTASWRGVYSRAAFNRINTVIKELIAAVIAVTKHGIFRTLQIWMSAAGTNIIAIVLPPVRIIVVPSLALVTFNKVLWGMALSALLMQVSDLMQRINFTMPKFKDHEKRVWKQGQEIFCKILNY